MKPIVFGRIAREELTEATETHNDQRPGRGTAPDDWQTRPTDEDPNP